MYGTGTKKMLNMLILDILKEYSDQEHHLHQQDIMDLLKKNYDMDCDRRSVKANILSLKELGYEISMENGYYLMEREFEDAELRLLIDAVLNSSAMTTHQAKALIDKLRGQSSRYFSAKVSHVCNLPELHHGDNTQLLYAIDTINDAISAGKKISFVYNDYGTDFHLHPRREDPYVVNPYQMAAKNGRYYLIGNVDKYDNVAHFRLDRMTYVTLREEPSKPMGRVQGLEEGLCLPRHMAEHIYMFSGPGVKIRMRVKKHLMNELVDWFGKDFWISRESEEEMTVSLTVNENAMFYWALQYGPYVEVLEPETLRTRIAKSITAIAEKYKEDL